MADSLPGTPDEGLLTAEQELKDDDDDDDDDDCFYIALFSALEQTHCARMWFYMMVIDRTSYLDHSWATDELFLSETGLVAIKKLNRWPFQVQFFC